MIGDPKIVDPARRDVRRAEDAPAVELGFVPFDCSRAGAQGDEPWKRTAATWDWPEPYQGE